MHTRCMDWSIAICDDYWLEIVPESLNNPPAVLILWITSTE